MNPADLESLIRTRRTVRHFKPDPLPDDLLLRLLDLARWAPSGYNLQPTHFIIVDDPAVKARLRRAAMDQFQVTEAPATVVFCGDRRVLTSTFPHTLEHPEALDPANAKYRAALEKFVPLAFSTKPAGLGWLWKASILPVAKLATPIPQMPAIFRNYWLAKQVMLAAMVFMLAAHAEGLGTCPMEGFDESRVKRVLRLPRHVHVVLVIPIGHPRPMKNEKSRLPLERMVHRNGW